MLPAAGPSGAAGGAGRGWCRTVVDPRVWVALMLPDLPCWGAHRAGAGLVVARAAPVRVRKTSSRLGRCRESSVTPMPSSASRWTARGRASSPGTATESWLRPEGSGTPEPISARMLRDVVEPGRIGRADLDPLTADHPLEAVRGVVGDDPAVVDDADLVGQRVGLVQVLGGQQHGRSLGDEVADDVPHVLALGRVEAGGRLVEEDHRRAADQARGQVEPPAHAAGVGLGHLAGGVGEVEPVQQLRGAGLGLAGAQVEQLADHDQVLGAGEVLVDRGVLAGQADGVADLLRLA